MSFVKEGIACTAEVYSRPRLYTLGHILAELDMLSDYMVQLSHCVERIFGVFRIAIRLACDVAYGLNWMRLVV